MGDRVADFGGTPVLVIKIGRSLDLGRSVYDATRCAWKVDPERASAAAYVVAARRGEVLDVFVATRWVPADDPAIAHLSDPDNDAGRFGFEGRPAPEDVRRRWIGTQLPPALMRRGAASPVRYVNVP